ncbi:MAG: hypothetical protein D6788_10305 [Planctomycetota bacterium]|nr:MAG: hypothetical protein D6788_10305 [Planctomycetota bacterium]
MTTATTSTHAPASAGWRSGLRPRWIARGFWCAMLAMHVPALWHAAGRVFTETPALESVLTALLLAVTVLFFVLKVLGFRFLRHRPDKQTIVAACVIVALLHVRLFRPNDAPAFVVEYTTAVATISWILPRSPLLTRRRTGESSDRAARAKHLPALRPFPHIAWLDVFRPHCWTGAYRLFILRAPPA